MSRLSLPLVVLALLSCTQSAPRVERLSSLREQFTAPLGTARLSFVPRSEALGFDDAGGVRIPRFALHPTIARTVDVRLPAHANGAFTLRDGATWIDVSLIGATTAASAIDEGALVYRDALAGAMVVHVPSPIGTEELVRFSSAPKRPELRHEVVLHGVHALRLVEGVLEVLGEGGDPIFHTTYPTVIDAKGKIVRGALRVEGCAVDRDVAPPWGRSLPAPGSERCTVIASWDPAGLAYPILVDPPWSSTGSLAEKRSGPKVATFTNAAAPACASGCVLVVNGSDFKTSGLSPVYMNSAELYNVATGTFATVAAPGVRNGFAAVGLPNGKAMIAGGSSGIDASGALDTTLIFDPVSGTWTSGGKLPGGARYQLAGAAVTVGSEWYVWMSGGRKFVTGGSTSGVVTNTVDRYEGSKGTWTSEVPLITARALHEMVAYPKASGLGVVVAGGEGASGPIGAPEALTGFTWASVGTMSARTMPVAVELDTSFIFAGGDFSAAAEVLNKSTSTMVAAPSGLSAGRAALAGAAAGTTVKRAIFVGGQKTYFEYTSGRITDIFDNTGTRRGSVAPSQSRIGAVGASLPNGKALFLGGYASCGDLLCSTVTWPAYDELFAPMANGASCTDVTECDSMFCVDGVCCNSACTDKCAACDGATKGTCSAITGAPHGARGSCPGAGTTCGSTCDGTTTASCTYSTAMCSAQSCSGGTKTGAAFCNGSGTCGTPTTSSCAPYTCTADGKDCRTTCAANTDCVTGFKCSVGVCVMAGGAGSPCSPATPTDCTAGLSCVDGVCCTTASCSDGKRCNVAPKPGTCLLPLGTKCTAAADCGTGNCVDGVCCDSACLGQCEACDLPGGSLGTCSPVIGPPHGTRDACAMGSDICKALECDGNKNRTKCVAYAKGPETECKPASCADGTAVEASACDGSGACRAGTSVPCGAYACDGAKCRTSCATTSDCASGFVCESSKCVPPRPKCSDDLQSSRPSESQPPKACAPYACDPSTGNCYSECATSTQCAPERVCDGSKCVPAPASSEDDGGCAMGARGSAFGAFAIMLVGALARRRRLTR